MICERCGWLVGKDCTCRRQRDELSLARLLGLVAGRHREAVARAQASGWAERTTPDGPERRPAG